MKNRSQIIIAVDFDLTIVKSDFPKILRTRRFAKWAINKLHKQGFYIIIWTCRHEEHEAQAYQYLTEKNISFDSINTQHAALVEHFQNNTRKISADFYIDDKNLSLFGLPNWLILYCIIHFRKYFITPSLSLTK